MDKFIQKVAVEAGRVVYKRFGKDKAEYMKSDNAWDLVTKADLMSEKIIVSQIKKKYPEHGILAEESGAVNHKAEYVWHIDPIDGTMNFSLGVPLFGVMIALARNKQVILSAIYLPMTKELFFAKEGKGAFLNGKRVHCTTKKNLERSLGVGQLKTSGRPAKFIRNILDYVKGHRLVLNSFGCMSVNVCYVACGRRDWSVALDGAVHDFAPPYLLLKESGCKVTDTKGKPWKLGTGGFVAANPSLHKQLLKLTKDV